MRWILRGILGAAVVGIAALVLFPQWGAGVRRDAIALVGGEARLEADEVDSDDSSATSEPATRDDDGPDATGFDLPNSPRTVPADDAAPPEAERSYGSSVIEGVDRMLDAQAEILGQEPEGLRSTLSEADAALTRIKRENAAGLREASRQSRVRGPASPNVVLVFEDRFSADDAESLADAPGWKGLLASGIRYTEVYASGTDDLRTNVACVLEGLPFDAAARTSAPSVGELNLLESLWTSGFSTGVIGDLSPFYAASGSESVRESRRLDYAMGYLPGDPPGVFRVNGAAIESSGGKTRIERMRSEVSYFLEQRRSGRPFALAISFPGRVAGDLETQDASAPERHAAAGALLEQVRRDLARSIMDRETVVVFVGVPGAAAFADGNDATELERGLRATVVVSSPLRWPTVTTDDRLMTTSEIPSLVTRFVGAFPPPPWPSMAPGADTPASAKAAAKTTDPRAIGWRMPDGTLFRWGDLLIRKRDDGDSTVRLWEGTANGWSEDLSTVHPELLAEFEAFLKRKGH